MWLCLQRYDLLVEDGNININQMLLSDLEKLCSSGAISTEVSIYCAYIKFNKIVQLSSVGCRIDTICLSFVTLAMNYGV